MFQTNHVSSVKMSMNSDFKCFIEWNGENSLVFQYICFILIFVSNYFTSPLKSDIMIGKLKKWLTVNSKVMLKHPIFIKNSIFKYNFY